MKVPQQANAPLPKYVVLEAKYRPAAPTPLDPDSKLFVCFMVVKAEVEARTSLEALEKGRRYLSHPIVEEALSFWARIEAAKALKNASKARNVYARTPA